MPATAGYACPCCMPTFFHEDRKIVDEHLKVCSDSYHLFRPIPICGYACMQCLMAFPTHVEARDHIEKQSHYEICPQFNGNKCNPGQPILVPQWFIDYQIQIYQTVPWHVECITCSVNFGLYDDKLEDVMSASSSEQLQEHLSNGHTCRLDSCPRPTSVSEVNLQEFLFRMVRTENSGNEYETQETSSESSLLGDSAPVKRNLNSMMITVALKKRKIGSQTESKNYTSVSRSGEFPAVSFAQAGNVKCTAVETCEGFPEYQAHINSESLNSTSKFPEANSFQTDTSVSDASKTTSHWHLAKTRCVIQPNQRSPETTTEEYTDFEIPELTSMKQVVFLDLDNVGNFFEQLSSNIPDKTFIWVFRGGKNSWKPPKARNLVYQDAVNRGLIHIQAKCGVNKDAADMAICLMIGYMDAKLDKSIPFTVVSGDTGFLEMEFQFRGNRRQVVVVSPRCTEKHELSILLKSVVDR